MSQPDDTSITGSKIVLKDDDEMLYEVCRPTWQERVLETWPFFVGMVMILTGVAAHG